MNEKKANKAAKSSVNEPKAKRITKDQAADLLKKRGFNAAVENGVVMVFVNEGEKDVQGVLDKETAVLKEIGYDASYGIRAAKKEKVNP